MTRDLGRRIRKLESILPPLITDYDSWMFGLLWFAVAYYFGNPLPDETPFAAYARALGYADESEFNRAMADNYLEVSNRVSRAEHKICARFGIDIPSLEDCDLEMFSKALQRMEADLPRLYKVHLKIVLRRVNNLAWMRIHDVDVSRYLRCFA